MKKQLIILWIGIGLVFLAILFPPWMLRGSFRGYGFLFSGSHFGVIEPSRLTAEILLIVLLTAGALYTNHVASEEARRRIKLVIKFLAWGVAVIILCVVTLICVFRVINWQAKKVQPWDSLPDAPAIPPLPPGFVLDADITTPIHDAATHGNLTDVERYLQNGIAVDARDKLGQTPLMVAGSLPVAVFLVDNGADVNARSTSGWTPLYLAAVNGRLDVVKYLADKGADVNAKNKDGLTPLTGAVRNSHKEIVEFLKQHGAKE